MEGEWSCERCVLLSVADGTFSGDEENGDLEIRTFVLLLPPEADRFLANGA
jgi:hypothetical protein